MSNLRLPETRVNLSALSNESYGKLRAEINSVGDGSFNNLRNLVLRNEFPGEHKDDEPTKIALDEVQFLIKVLGSEIVSTIVTTADVSEEKSASE